MSEISEETWGAGNVPAEETLGTPRLGTLRQTQKKAIPELLLSVGLSFLVSSVGRLFTGLR